MAKDDLIWWDTKRIEALIAPPAIIRGGRDGIRVLRGDDVLYHVLPEHWRAAEKLCDVKLAMTSVVWADEWDPEHPPAHITRNKIDFRVTRLEADTLHRVPAYVMEKLKRAEARGIRFDALAMLLGRQIHWGEGADGEAPNLCGIVQHGPQIGIWCAVGEWYS